MKLLIWAIIWYCTLPAAVHGGSPLVIGYLPEYRLRGFEPDRLKGVSDLVLFSVSLSKEGKVGDGPLSTTHQSELKRVRKSFRGRVLLTVGGWERSAGFAKVSAAVGLRKAFIARLTALCREHDLAGIDYDWEHPKTEREIANYAALIRETKQALSQRHGLVTVAQAGWQDLTKEVYNVVDRVHLMAYDHPFPQATFEKAKSDVERVLGFGCPAEKIALGLPFYGRNRSGVAKTYSELKGQGNLNGGFAFNGPATIRRKVEFAKQHRLAGVMIWELGQDAGGADSLLTVIRRAW